MVNHKEELLFSSSKMCPKQSKTLEHFALAKKDMDIKIHHFIELSLISCSKGEILQIIMVQVESLFMGKSLLIKISTTSIQCLDYFQWQMPAKIQMDLNFLLQL